MDFNKILTNWYSINKRDLPWRKTQDPYYIWLSEIILQQTQVKQGLPYYKAFVEKFPSIFDLANASEDSVLKLWQGLGYYSRARNLHHSAKIVVEDFAGVFPVDYKDLIKLKGVGDYTASAISSICVDAPNAVVDGNVYRVLSRYFGIHTPINSTQGIKEFKIVAQKLLPKRNIGDYNQAIMEFGARQCKPKNPDCNVCPLNTSCIALQKKQIDKLPFKLKKTKIRKRYFNYLVVISGDQKVVLEQRKGKGIWQNLYQFPLIETEKSISENEFIKSKGLMINISNNYNALNLYNEKDVVHKLSHQHLHTKFWIIEVDQLSEKGIPISKIKNYAVPILIGNFLKSFNF